MINLKCGLHKKQFGITNLVQLSTTVGAGDQDIFLVCPDCDKVQSNVTALSDTIDTIKGQLDGQRDSQASGVRQ